MSYVVFFFRVMKTRSLKNGAWLGEIHVDNFGLDSMTLRNESPSFLPFFPPSQIILALSKASSPSTFHLVVSVWLLSATVFVLSFPLVLFVVASFSPCVILLLYLLSRCCFRLSLSLSFTTFPSVFSFLFLSCHCFILASSNTFLFFALLLCLPLSSFTSFPSIFLFCSFLCHCFYSTLFISQVSYIVLLPYLRVDLSPFPSPVLSLALPGVFITLPSFSVKHFQTLYHPISLPIALVSRLAPARFLSLTCASFTWFKVPLSVVCLHLCSDNAPDIEFGVLCLYLFIYRFSPLLRFL